MKENLSLEIRKAYRLLFDYQQRILNLMQFISSTYNIPYKNGKPLFSGRGSNKLNNWSWDWIYMYCYEFHFQKNEDTNSLWFSVILRNDTGFFESQIEDSTINRLDIENFKDVENSSTDLIFIAGNPNWNFDVLKKATLNEKEYIKEQNVFFKRYKLENFFTEENTLIQLKDFEKECSNYSISINVIDKIL
ncbi:hypothetical protein PG913_06225 [Tenacibaculum pacificus]|uniref:hypothetical protein n=1 Tax=Tenacibaculum pacificus TaxID=3018314 RepID=UPI0022F3CE65|nr:hypothetical protein [Tenacibaculum pacificus]WBX74758.1 hypothetical protein PG913_06225 [Tenacibaculum pacificus]